VRFVANNRPGASGQLGMEAIFNAAPDGYTIGAIGSLNVSTLPLERPVRWKAEEFTYFANVVDDACGLWVLPGSPLRSLGDLVAALKRRPESLSVGSAAGVGSDDHLVLLGLEEKADVRALHAPFNGTAQVQRDLLGGSVDVASFNMSEGITLMRDGKIRCIGQAAPQRWSAAAEVRPSASRLRRGGGLGARHRRAPASPGGGAHDGGRLHRDLRRPRLHARCGTRLPAAAAAGRAGLSRHGAGRREVCGRCSRAGPGGGEGWGEKELLPHAPSTFFGSLAPAPDGGTGRDGGPAALRARPVIQGRGAVQRDPHPPCAPAAGGRKGRPVARASRASAAIRPTRQPGKRCLSTWPKAR